MIIKNKVESTGIEPVLTGCQPVVIPLYQDPMLVNLYKLRTTMIKLYRNVVWFDKHYFLNQSQKRLTKRHLYFII